MESLEETQCGSKDRYMEDAKKLVPEGISENHPHDITITSESPNYSKGL